MDDYICKLKFCGKGNEFVFTSHGTSSVGLIKISEIKNGATNIVHKYGSFNKIEQKDKGKKSKRKTKNEKYINFEFLK